MRAHVICNNDSVEHVVFGTDAEAKTVMEQLRDAHLAELEKQAGADRWAGYKDSIAGVYYWHIHTVECTKFELWRDLPGTIQGESDVW